MAQKTNLIGLMIREGLISFVRIDRTVFKKTDEEKIKLQNVRNQHNRAVRKLGYNPRKTFNPPGLEL